MGDAIDAAVAAATSPKPEQRAPARIGLSTGRQVVLNVPLDMTDAEWAELIGLIALDIRPKVSAASRPASRLLLPTQ